MSLANLSNGKLLQKFQVTLWWYDHCQAQGNIICLLVLGLCSLSLAEPKPKAKAQALDYYGEYGEGDYNYADYGEAGDYSYGQGECHAQCKDN